MPAHAEVGLAAVDGRNDGVKLHVLDVQVIAQLVAQSLGKLGVDAHDLAVLDVLIGIEGGVGGHHQGTLR